MVTRLRDKSRTMARSGGGDSRGGDCGSRRRSALGVFLCLFISALPAFSDPLAFTGDPEVVFGFGGPGGPDEWDLSGLQFVNTENGVQITGALSLSLPEGGVPTGGGLTIVTQRFFDAPIGTSVIPLSHVSGTFANGAGGLWITSIGVATILSPSQQSGSPCQSAAGVDLGTAEGPFGPGGTFNQTSTVNFGSSPCETFGGPLTFPNELMQAFSIGYFFNGSAGSFTIDLGNSVLSEMTEVVAEPPGPPVPVPEPSSTFLLGGTFLIILCRTYANRQAAIHGRRSTWVAGTIGLCGRGFRADER